MFEVEKETSTEAQGFFQVFVIILRFLFWLCVWTLDSALFSVTDSKDRFSSQKLSQETFEKLEPDFSFSEICQMIFDFQLVDICSLFRLSLFG